jgi:hypothetical protein
MATKTKPQQSRPSIKIPKGTKLVVVTDEPGDESSSLGGESIYAEVGTTGLKRFGGIIQDEFLPELRGKRGVRVYTEMSQNDGSIGSVLRATEDLIRSVEWSAEPGGTTPSDIEARDFVYSCMTDMSHSWNDLISSIITMLVYGWDWEEVVYKQRQGPQKPRGETASSKYIDGRIGWRKFATRSQESLYDWILDDNGGIRALRQQGLPDLKLREIPIEKSLLFRTRRNRNSPEGYSYLRTSYLAWYMKRSLQEIEGIGAERDFTGALIVKLPPRATEADKNKALTLIEKWKVDEQFGAVVPDGWEVTLINSPGNKQIDTDKAILRYQAEIMMSFLAQFIRLGQVKVGTQALVTGQRDFFYLAIKAVCDNIEETLNMFAIPPLIRLNDFGELTDFPRIVHGEVGQTDVEVFIDAITKIVNSNPDIIGNLSPSDVSYVRTAIGLPPLSGEKLEEEEKAEDRIPAAITAGVNGNTNGSKPVNPKNKDDNRDDEDDEED